MLRKIGFDSGLRKQTHNILETGNKILIEVGQEKMADAFQKSRQQNQNLYLVGLITIKPKTNVSKV